MGPANRCRNIRRLTFLAGTVPGRHRPQTGSIKIPQTRSPSEWFHQRRPFSNPGRPAKARRRLRQNPQGSKKADRHGPPHGHLESPASRHPRRLDLRPRPHRPIFRRPPRPLVGSRRPHPHLLDAQAMGHPPLARHPRRNYRRLCRRQINNDEITGPKTRLGIRRSQGECQGSR